MTLMTTSAILTIEPTEKERGRGRGGTVPVIRMQLQGQRGEGRRRENGEVGFGPPPCPLALWGVLQCEILASTVW